MNKLWLIQAITFLSAFLLFQIELIIGKVFLPNFGGSFMVWGACVVFFQAFFLFGYKYAQFILEKIGIEKYRKYHCLLALIPLLSFPGRSLPLHFDAVSLPMMLAVFLQLALIIGLVFFVLTTTSIIWQVWLSASNLPERKNPYVLFAVSNWGSFAALLSYPFFFEYKLNLVTQQNLWRVGYLIFVALQWWGLKMIDLRPIKARKLDLKPVPMKKAISWACYAAAGVMMFLAVTNIMTSEIAPVPLLWIVPLMIYLISFVLNFKKKPYCPKWLKEEFHFLIGLGVISYFIIQSPILPMILNICLLCAITYYVCMFTQFKLHQEKPQDDRYLAYFYFIIALGSFAGGVLVTWIIPAISSTFVEYFSGFLVIGIAFLLKEKQKVNPWMYLSALIAVSLLFIWPDIFNQEALRFSAIQYITLILLMIVMALLFSSYQRNSKALVMVLGACIVLAPQIESHWNQADYIYQKRNYYGISRIMEEDDARIFLHGKTIHGVQYKDPNKAHIPLSYFGYSSPLGEVLLKEKKQPKSIGIIGLGIGTMGAYFQENWMVDYFELEADVYAMAQEHFTFIKNSKGDVSYHIGDGRLLLQTIENNTYDVLIADAFSGDSIPIHLMTKEALELYQQKIKDSGMILFHISNRYIDVTQPLFRTAQFINAHVAIKEGPSKTEYEEHSLWIALTWSKPHYDMLTKQMGWGVAREMDQSIKVWTDAYSSVLPYIYYDELLNDLNVFFNFITSQKKKKPS